MDLGAWLRGLGLGLYEAAFRDNDVDAAVLPSLTAEDLREIGVTSVGHRRRLLDAIAALRGPAQAAASTGDAPALPPQPDISPAPLAAAMPAGESAGAERRQVTVLFCDLAGSTALSAQLDPEDLREVMAAYRHAVTEAVHRQRGYVAKFLGDGTWPSVAARSRNGAGTRWTGCWRTGRERSPVDRLLAHRARGAALMQLGQLREARTEFEAIPPLYDPARDRGLASRCVTDPRTSGLSFLALVLEIMGHPEEARRTADEAARCAAELGHANTTGRVLCHGKGERAQLLRDVPATRDCAEAILALAAEHDMPMWHGYGLVLRGWTLAEEGRTADGASLVRQGIAELDALGTVFHRTHHLGLLAGIETRRGDPAAGLRVLEEARDETARSEVQIFEAELRRTEGELRFRAGRPEEAEQCFAAAVRTAREQEARFFELRAACGLARLWRCQGRHAEARALLAPVCVLFTEDISLPDLSEARAFLGDLGGFCASSRVR